MRRTGSRESRESRDASATSPTSIAVKTFSIRLGSRRNQRPPHQKIRSITTVKATIETRRIGHMMGPPFRKLSIIKLLLQLLGSSPLFQIGWTRVEQKFSLFLSDAPLGRERHLYFA